MSFSLIILPQFDGLMSVNWLNRLWSVRLEIYGPFFASAGNLSFPPPHFPLSLPLCLCLSLSCAECKLQKSLFAIQCFQDVGWKEKFKQRLVSAICLEQLETEESRLFLMEKTKKKKLDKDVLCTKKRGLKKFGRREDEDELDTRLTTRAHTV